jgi:hypothetical protein
MQFDQMRNFVTVVQFFCADIWNQQLSSIQTARVGLP